MKSTLILYHFENCPFCRKVRDYIREHHWNIEQKDIQINSEYRAELLKIGGKTQVPCLVINGVAKYESNDIISWLSKNEDQK